MRLVHPFFSIACIAASLSLATPAWAQVYKCQGPDGRIEYTGTPCGSGPQQQLSIKGSSAASPASPAPARSPGQAQPSGGRVTDYWHAVRCEIFRMRVEVLTAGLAEMTSKLEDKSWRSRRMVVMNEQLQAYQQQDDQCRKTPMRWYVDQVGFKTQVCRAEFAQLWRHAQAWAQEDSQAAYQAGQLVEDMRLKIGKMNCVAPRR